MLNNLSFVEQSLNSNLFFLRTIREYCTNIELSFYENNEEYSDRAQSLRNRCEELGRKIVESTNGVVPPALLEYQLFLTEFTLETEILTEKLFAIDLATEITEQELNFKPGTKQEPSEELVEILQQFNQEASSIVNDFTAFAIEIRDKLKSNVLFSYSYISFYDYMIIIADIYKKGLARLNEQLQVDPTYTISNRLQFSVSMYEILLFTRGFIDPSAREYRKDLDALIEEYNPLLEDYNTIALTPENQLQLTIRNIEIVTKMKDLFSKMLQDLLEAKVYFIVDAVTINNFYASINYFYYTLIVEKDYLVSINPIDSEM